LLASFVAGPENPPENASATREMQAWSAQSAPNLWHPPVDSLHSIDFSADRAAPFLLTLELEGVKTTSFFDSF
jgi:hypothetical protein